MIDRHFAFAETMCALSELLGPTTKAVFRDDGHRKGERIIESLAECLTDEGKDRLRLFFQGWISPREHGIYTDAVEQGDQQRYGGRDVEDLAAIMRDHAQPGKKYPFAYHALVMKKVASRPDSRELVRRLFIVSGVSAFEALLIALATEIMRNDPSTISSGERYSLAEVLSFATKEAMIEAAIERKLNTLTRGGLENWAKWVASHTEIQLAALALDWHAATEVFLRRNAIVHTQGKANADYLGNVQDPPPPGATLECTQTYTKLALEALFVLGTLLSTKVWIFLDGDATRTALAVAGLTAGEISYCEHWRGAARVYRFIRGYLPDDEQLQTRIFEWYSRLKADASEARAELEAFDASNRPGWRFAKALLLGEPDQALKDLPAVLKSGSISVGDMRRLDVYASLRAHPHFGSVVESALPPSDSETR